MADVSWSAALRRCEGVVARKIAGETILVPVRGNLADMQRIFCLDPVAAFVWEQLDGRRTLAQVRSGVVERFDVTAEQAGADIQEFVAELAEAALIQEAS